MKRISLALLFLLLACGNVMAATYYVKSGGNDSLDGLSDSQAWRTIGKVNSASFSDGDRVLFRRDDIWIGRLNIPSSGSVGNPIIFANYGSGVNPIIDANSVNARCISVSDISYIIIDGIDCRNATNSGIAGNGYSNHITIQNLTISAMGSTDAIATAVNGSGGYWTITNCTITNIAQVGIELTGGNNIVTYNNISYTNVIYTGWGAGIHITQATGADAHTEIAYNTIHDNGGVGAGGLTHGIYIDEGTTNQNVHHNEITNSSKGHGIKFAGSGNVHHNYINGSTYAGVGTGGNGTSDSTVVIWNNILTGNKNGVWELSQGAGNLDISVYNNTMYLNNNTLDDIYTDEIKIEDDVKSLVIKNNIIYATPNRYAYFMVRQTHATINNNCIYQTSGSLIHYNGTARSWPTWQGYGFDKDGVNANPLFESSSDFHLQASSPCVNSGVILASIIDDYEGVARPIGEGYDMGAYEYVNVAFDITAPSAVSNLSVTGSTMSAVSLRWTSPGDDGVSGTAASYDIRYSTVPITEDRWQTSELVTGEPVPQIAGSIQTMTVSGVTSGRTYYFAMKVSDEVPNTSTLSNVASGTTATVPDTTPPYTTGYYPAKSAINVARGVNIAVHVKDDGAGVDINTIVMLVNGVAVTPTITGMPADYTLTYDPSVDFAFGQTVMVTIDARDLAP